MSSIDQPESRAEFIDSPLAATADLALLPLMKNAVLPRVVVPRYDGSDVTAGIVHIGFGGFHRAHQAAYLHQLMQQGEATGWGIIGVNVLPRDLPMHRAMTSQGCQYTLIERRPSGDDSAQVIGSVIRHLFAPTSTADVLEQLADPNVRIVSLTITESGYEQDTVTGEFAPTSREVLDDLAGAQPPKSALGLIVEGVRLRRAAGIEPFTVLSCDNMPHNGQVAKRSLIGFAARRDPETAEYIAQNIAFPGSMVDRITPVTTDADRVEVRNTWKIDDAWPVVSESYAQWVVEDNFPTGRPRLEAVGVQFVEDVAPYEEMKLRLLNAGHQALAQPAALLGIRYVDQAIRDPLLADFFTAYLAEACPTVDSTIDVDLTQYCNTLATRFSNPAIADTIDRIVHDTDSRLAAFLVPPTVDNRRADRAAPCAAAIFACALLRTTRNVTVAEHWPDIVRGSTALGELAHDEAFTATVVTYINQIRREGPASALRAALATAANPANSSHLEGQHHA